MVNALSPQMVTHSGKYSRLVMLRPALKYKPESRRLWHVDFNAYIACSSHLILTAASPLLMTISAEVWWKEKPLCSLIFSYSALAILWITSFIHSMRIYKL